MTVTAATANFGLRILLALLFDPERRPDEKVLFAFIAAVPGRNPSYDQISAELRLSRKRISRALKGLEASGWLTPQDAPRRTVGGQWRSTGKTMYLLTPHGAGRQIVLMPPGVRRKLTQPRPDRSASVSDLDATSATGKHADTRGGASPSSVRCSASIGARSRARWKS